VNSTEWLMLVAIGEFSIALMFWVRLGYADREIQNLENTIDKMRAVESFAERDRRIQKWLGLILRVQENMMSSLEDLKAAQAVTDAKIAAVKTDVETLLAKLAAVPVAGLTADQQTALDAVVAHANAINASLSGVDAEVNPVPAA
jgi:hypothetical protein